MSRFRRSSIATVLLMAAVGCVEHAIAPADDARIAADTGLGRDAQDADAAQNADTAFADAEADAGQDDAATPATDAEPFDALEPDLGVPDAGPLDGATGTFACGPMTCDLSTQFCHIHGMRLAGELQITYLCEPLPAGCLPQPDCACIPIGGTCSCSGTWSSGLSRSCYSP